MSLNLFQNKIIDVINENNFDNEILNFGYDDIVAKNKNRVLIYKNYNEKNLLEMIEEDNETKVNPFFWNHKFCKKNNLDYNCDSIDDMLVNFSDYKHGEILCNINMMETLYMYLKDENYDNLMLEKHTFAKFLINYKHKLPLTRGYLRLITRIFSNLCVDNYMLSDFLFSNSVPRFNFEDTNTILNGIYINDINYAGFLILRNKMKISTGDKLLYISILFEHYNDTLTQSNSIGISENNKNNYIGFLLLQIDLDSHHINLYQDVIVSYVNKGGSLDFYYTDNIELNKELKIMIKFAKNLL